MSIKSLCILPNPILRQKSRCVEHIDESVVSLAHDMLETMYDASGIGLAAIQIGTPLRIVVIDIAIGDEPKSPRIFINPEIIKVSDERSIYKEGCLSIPDYSYEVERPASVCVHFIDENGDKQEIQADGLLATCLQHEIDHLNGILFIDHISKLKRDIVLRKFKKQSKRNSTSDVNE